jgi:hypothetical protein
VLNPESRRAFVAVYGTGGPLEWIADLYIDAGKLLGLDADTKRLWHLPQPDKYATTPGGKPPAKDALLIGYEIEFTGRAASLAYPQESGYHNFHDNNGQKLKYAVVVSQATREQYEKTRPNTIHRKSYFENKSTPVRTFFRDNRGAVTFGTIQLADQPPAHFAAFLRIMMEPRLVGIMKA